MAYRRRFIELASRLGSRCLGCFGRLGKRTGAAGRNSIECIKSIANRGHQVLRKLLAGLVLLQLKDFRLLALYVALIGYLELIYRLWCFKNVNFDFIFPILFAFPAGALLFLLSAVFPLKVNKALSFAMILLAVLVYNLQLIYYAVFQTPLVLFSLVGAEDAMQFGDVIVSTVFKNGIGVILLFMPFILLASANRKVSFKRAKPAAICAAVIFCTVTYAVSMICVDMTGKNNLSQYVLYHKVFSPELSVGKLGLMTTMRLDLKHLIAGYMHIEDTIAETAGDIGDDKSNKTTGRNGDNKRKNTGGGSGVSGTGKVSDAGTSVKPGKSYGYNVMDIDFDALAAKETDQSLIGMHRYFSSVKPTAKNKYTGMFEGCNLILITAESFYPYAMSPELTPTLYMMSKEGFVFDDFYNPVWGVSTSDGEYAACTGLIPKSGVWSFAQSGRNYMPFAMGNQFKKLGYMTKAYHDHTYTYYKRNISHPNMGYDYKGVGNGLNIKVTWPESDLEMIDVTAPEYIGSKPFHTYYMTVSGHLEYNFSGNYIAVKNRHLVDNLPYSEASKAYIACNIELELAMKSLINKLEAAGIADKTVMAINPDHYPYGLPRECIDELAGHKIEDRFELYKSRLILWKKGMRPVKIDKPCASMDIMPTLSNLFGLKYDSRLLMGRDILSDAPGLVIFMNRSWITDRASYDAVSNKATFKDGTVSDDEYVNAINREVAGKFEYSAKILDSDYYRKVVATGDSVGASNSGE